ncbi:MAG: hypothetical protein A2Y10_05860 [Planctomycetes bacterium GWF2_41_51]|nr:MAG: hypothetical protein A2Y10_05860 [Planctomycetes bacterium GWF2_41_51]
MEPSKSRVYMWQNNLCITYTITFKMFEDYFLANGWIVVQDARQADWILIGACGGFLPQIKDYVEKIKTLATLGKKIAVYGCLPKIAPEEFKKSGASVNLYIPPSRPQDIEKIVSDPSIPWKELRESCGFRKEDYRKYDPKKKYVVIQYGCDATCVYCPHKIGMGPRISRPKEEVLSLVRASLANGANTIFLEGQDSGSWGTDLVPAQNYLDVLEPILEMPGDFEVHIGQFSSGWILHYGEKLLKAFGHPRVTDIKTPIQSANPRILTLMGRDPRVKEIGPFLKNLRHSKKKMNIRTDIMIGFPTETKQELDMTLEFARNHFYEIACFGFEIHPNTPIAKMDTKFHTKEVIEERVQYAIKFLEEDPQIITHRGGQVYDTLITREKRKEELVVRLIR